MAKRYFTLDEANALVPRVAEIMNRALQLHSHLRMVTQQLSRAGLQVTPSLLSGQSEIESDPPVLRLLAHARGLYDAVRETVDGIEKIGAQVKDLETGLVDFYSYLDGADEVLLCWRIGEERIDYYHRPDAGFSGRKPVEGHDFANRPDPS